MRLVWRKRLPQAIGDRAPRHHDHRQRSALATQGAQAHHPAVSWLGAAVFDRIMRPSEEACLAAWRRELIAPLEGAVLEIGAGTGANLPHYGKHVAQLWLAEPDRHMRARLERRLHESSGRPATVLEEAAEALSLGDETLDAAVVTLTLCSVSSPDAVVAELYRVLRPGGRLVFLEHVASDDPERYRWQRRLEPLWLRLAGNCHLTRRTGDIIAAAGFDFERLEKESMRKALPFVRPTIRGVAYKAKRAA